MEHEDRTWRFSGFRSPNFTSVPDEFFDVLSPRLNGGEVKVLLYIIRRTFGFKKERDNISLSQMLNGIVKKNGERLDYGTGMSKPSVCRALNTLEEKEVIISTKQFDFKGGCVATSYQLNMSGVRNTSTREQVLGDEKNGGEDTPGKKMRQGGESQNFTRPLVKKRDTQDTVNNKQLNNVNVVEKAAKHNPLHDLADQAHPPELLELIASDILDDLGDEHSLTFYRLVAHKVPEAIIRKALSELKEGRVRSRARVFTSRMVAYAKQAKDAHRCDTLADGRQVLVERFKSQ